MDEHKSSYIEVLANDFFLLFLIWFFAMDLLYLIELAIIVLD